MADKPASRPIAKGLARGSGFVGQFALPGMIPEFVKRSDGGVERYSTEHEAQAAASMALTARLGTRTSQPNRTKEYARLSGEELAHLLTIADVTPSAFARFYGVPRDRVLGWLRGEQDIPHAAHILAHVMKDRAVTAEIEAVTSKALEDGAR